MNLSVFPSDNFFRNYRFIEISVIADIFLSGYRLSVIAIRLFVINLSLIAIRFSVIVPTTGVNVADDGVNVALCPVAWRV